MYATTGTSGVIEDDMSGKNSSRKLGTTRGSLRRSCTAKAFCISRTAAKSGRACEWGGWGRLSDDGLGQNNPDRSEDPWGAGCPGPILRCRCWPTFPDSELERKGGPLTRRMVTTWTVTRVRWEQA